MITRTAERHPVGALGRMGVVAALHVGVLFVIARSMGIGTKLPDPPPVVTRFIDEPQPPIDLPPTPTIKIETPYSPYVDHQQFPDLVFEQPDVITGPPPDIIERPPGGETFRAPEIVAARPDGRYPLSLPPYPPEMIRAGNTGTADVEVYVLPNGRVGDARIVKSTGFDALDRSTLAEAKRNWRLVPATRDGVPFAQWHRLRVVFKLNQR